MTQARESAVVVMELLGYLSAGSLEHALLSGQLRIFVFLLGQLYKSSSSQSSAVGDSQEGRLPDTLSWLSLSIPSPVPPPLPSPLLRSLVWHGYPPHRAYGAYECGREGWWAQSGMTDPGTQELPPN